MKVGIVSASTILAQSGKPLAAHPYVHPTFFVDKQIALANLTLANAQARLNRHHEERARLLAAQPWGLRR